MNLGVFVADPAYVQTGPCAWRKPSWGNSISLGPVGKVSNQSVAAARLGADLTFVALPGRDPFSDLAPVGLRGAIISDCSHKPAFAFK